MTTNLLLTKMIQFHKKKASDNYPRGKRKPQLWTTYQQPHSEHQISQE